LVVLTVALVFDSVWGAAMVFLSLPLALSGVAAAFWMFKVAFTREAAVGVILVVGLAVHQSILLVDAALNRRRAHRDSGGDARLDAGMVLRAARSRASRAITCFAGVAHSVGGTDGDSHSAIAWRRPRTVAGTVGAMFVMPLLLVGRQLTKRKGRRAPHSAHESP
jgi:preprotein translocase subunit SecF